MASVVQNICLKVLVLNHNIRYVHRGGGGGPSIYILYLYYHLILKALGEILQCH